MQLIDAHCHLADPRLESQLEAVLERARALGITRFIQGGVDPEDWNRQLDLQGRWPQAFFPCFGLHPWWVASSLESEIEAALRLLPEYLSRGIALGETGLDHASRGGGPDGHFKQEAAFRKQLVLARDFDRPLVLHIVRAHPQALNILKEFPDPRRRGIVHSFTGSYEIARGYLDRGLSISVGGALVRKEGFETFKRAVVRLPPEALVLETDSPDQPPEGWPSELNEPSSLQWVARALGDLRGEEAIAILERSRENLERIFGLSRKDN